MGSAMKNVARLVSLGSKNMPVEEQFQNDLIRSIEMRINKPGRPASKTFKPSSMQCKRNSYYQIIGTKPDEGQTAYNMNGITTSGSDIHVYTQNNIIEMQKTMDVEWIDVEGFIKQRGLTDLEVKSKTGTETKLYNKKYNISFMCDGIVKYHGRYYIIEIKTESSNKWYSRSGVDKKHYNQAITYSLNFGIDDVIFIYINRDMLDMKCYMFSVTDEMRSEIVAYMDDVNGYVERQIAPPKDITDKRVCQYCSYQTTCKKEQ